MIVIDMIQKRASRLTSLIRYATQDKFFEGLVLILSVFSFIMGLLFFFTPDSLDNSLGFDIAFDWASPVFWGGVLLVCAVLLPILAIPHRTRQDSMWVGFGIGVVYCGISAAFVAASPQGGIPSGIVIYLFAAFVAMWVVAGCAFFQYEEATPDAASQNTLANHP